VGDADRILEEARVYGFEIRFAGQRPPPEWRGRVLFAEFTFYFDTRVWQRIEGDLAGIDLSSPIAVHFADGHLVPVSGSNKENQP
jgi:hypothetical protein